MAVDPRCQFWIEDGNHLFGKRGFLMSMCQEIADNFYPERADFTVTRTVGDQFADHLTTSYPLLARRDLGNSITSMLRPTGKDWMFMRTSREDREDDEARAWLEWATAIQRRAMQDRAALFSRATKEGDHDFVTFGQCIISTELNRNADTLLYRSWHFRDVVWRENVEGKVTTVHRKWKPTARDLNTYFRGKIDPKVEALLTGPNKDPYKEIECRHIILPVEDYEPPAGKKKPRTPYVSIHIDIENQFIMEEIGVFNRYYTIPRWQTISGSQYATSPATVCALPDGRLIQAMALTLLEAGEKGANPPLIATWDAIRSDIEVFAGGITKIDAEYDEKLGEALRPITQDLRGMATGFEMVKDIREMLKEAFFLNKLNMSPQGGGPEMTAFEVGQRVQEYIRQTLPLFEPMEADYNGGLCETTFDLLMRGGAFGDPRNIPDSLRGADIQFRFESPLSEAIEAQKAGKLQAANAIIAQNAGLDPAIAQLLDAEGAVRDVFRGISIPQKWVRTPEQMQAIKDYQQKQQQAQQLLAGLQASANVAKTVGESAQAFSGAMPQGGGADVAAAA